ncbi:MAG: hypothetical protein K0U45_03315 [Alphaproteobacteria bacterium]|nr:hypothetical protein [Alphaproteobacteria bacterium]
MNLTSKQGWNNFVEDVRKLPPLTKEQERDHRISFVYGNTKIENDNITREMVEEIDDKMQNAS